MKKERMMSKENEAKLLKGLRQTLDHLQGKPVPGIRVTRVYRPITPVEVKKLRKTLGLTQGRFAVVIGEGIAAVQSWEQGVRRPSGAAGKLIRMLTAHPELAEEAIQA